MKTDAERFWAKVDTTDDCWVWIGAKTGYGRLSRVIDGREHYFQAHRYSLILAGRPPAADEEVDHMCHNRACVRPEHLRTASHKQNAENLSGAHRDSKSGVRGVYWHSRDERWRATVGHQGRLHQKNFKTLDEAAEWSRTKRNELFSYNDADRASA